MIQKEKENGGKKRNNAIYCRVYELSKNVWRVWFEICCELSRKNIKEIAAYYREMRGNMQRSSNI